jgi:hypothetical protein
VPSAEHRTPDGTEQLQDHPDHYQDDPESHQKRNREQVPYYKQDNAKNDHYSSRDSASASVDPADPDLSWAIPTGFS